MNEPNLSAAERQTVETYDRSAALWADARNGDERFWGKEIGQLHALTPSGRVLDVGSGNGRDARQLTQAGYDVTGVDVSAELLKIAQANCPQATFLQASIYDLPFDTGTFDAIWAAAVLLHIPKRRQAEAFAELARVLRPNGTLFVAVKAGTGEQTETGPFGPRFFSYFTPQEICTLIADAGLDVRTVTSREAADTTWIAVHAVRRP